MAHGMVKKMLCLCVLLSVMACTPALAERKLNVVFFLVDDLGQRDVGCYGSSFYETPAIDALAREGMLFHNAYSTCHVCSPSRASILTGKYPARLNLTDWLGGRPEREYEQLHSAERIRALPDEEITLAETLRQHGYATANYGKAHLSRDPKTYGFDEAITGWVRSYYHPFSPTYSKTLPAKEGDYYTDRLTDAAIDFIERNKDKPFFVHMEHFAVHDPIQGRKDLVAKYERKLALMPKFEGAEYVLETNPDGPPLSADQLKALENNDQSKPHQDARVWWVKQRQDNVQFAGMVGAMDESLKRIRAKLKELGLEDNTIVIFTSDNGGMAASNQYRGIGHSRETLDSRFSTSNLPLRGAKGWNYEGGIRVPLIVHWPGRIEASSTSDAIVTGTDYYPTLLEMLGLPAVPGQHVDGRSFVPALRGGSYDRGPVYWHFPHYSNHGYQSPNGAIRMGRYKLLEYFENGTVQLFDLENDIGERHDLSRQDPVTTRRLQRQLHALRKSVDAKMPPVKTEESRHKAHERQQRRKVSRNLPADIERFAPGWKVRDWGGPAMKPGLREKWNGRNNVLLTHPLSRDKACVLSRTINVPANGNTSLVLAVNNHPHGNWKLVVRVNDKDVLTTDIDSSKWQEFRIDLTRHAGKAARIELQNQATGWSFEAAYWSRIAIESEGSGPNALRTSKVAPVIRVTDGLNKDGALVRNYKRGLRYAIDYFGNYGPYYVYLLGSDSESSVRRIYHQRAASRVNPKSSRSAEQQIEEFLKRPDVVAEMKAVLSGRAEGGLTWTQDPPVLYEDVTTSAKGREKDPIENTWGALHEYHHVFQMAHCDTRQPRDSDKHINSWIAEGMATYSSARFMENLGLIDFKRYMLDLRKSGGNIGSPGINDFMAQTPDWKLDNETYWDTGESAQVYYMLGAWATAYLIHEQAIDEVVVLKEWYFDIPRIGKSAAFEKHMGLSLPEFYRKFNAFIRQPDEKVLQTIPTAREGQVKGAGQIKSRAGCE